MPPAPPSWVSRLRAKFLVFDGPDGSGKSTQLRRFAAWAEASGLEVCEVREPGGTAIGEQIRRLLLSPDNGDIDLRCEMLLYMASRAQLVAQRIRPARREGKLVLADRFISSTLAYQGAAGGLAAEDIAAVGRVAVEDCWPDLVVLFDVDEETAARRLVGAPLARKKVTAEVTLFSDRMELKGADYHRTVRRGYLQQAEADPRRHLVIDGSGSEEEVFAALLRGVEERMRPGNDE